MDKDVLISKIADEVKAKLEGEGSGHDWWHVYRVWKMAKHISEKEQVDLMIVELAALLHDIADWKFHNGDDTVGPRIAGEMLEKHGVAKEIIASIRQIIQEGSFKGAGVKTVPSTLEGKVVQDADRLDAIGAIGIARTFAYGGHTNRTMYDPATKPVMHQTKEEYAKNSSPTINHFYEKLLLLKDLMNTETAKKITEGRHAFMEAYLDRFYKEWEGQI
ncbi:MAG TPA: HD domain-containing protein [Patescibacteria group bacterium]|nr:HD domain-containing protein [Patescibacteria group bacterium]